MIMLNRIVLFIWFLEESDLLILGVNKYNIIVLFLLNTFYVSLFDTF